MSHKVFKQVFLCILIFLVLASTIYAGSQTTSSSPASAIIARARMLLNESTASFWSDSEMLQWVNDGILDIISHSKCLETTETIGMYHGISKYTISEDFIKIGKVVYHNTDTNEYKALYHKSPDHFGHCEDIGEPAYWYEWESGVVVYPELDSDMESVAVVSWADTDDVAFVDTAEVAWVDLCLLPAEFTVYLTKRPEPIALSDMIPLPAIYDHPLVLYVYANGLFKDNQSIKATVIMTSYSQILDRFGQDFNALY